MGSPRSDDRRPAVSSHRAPASSVRSRDDSSNRVAAQTRTDAQGRYWFIEVAPGTYTVRENLIEFIDPNGDPMLTQTEPSAPAYYTVTVQPPRTAQIDFEQDTTGPKPNGFTSADSSLVHFTDSIGADLEVGDYSPATNGNGLAVYGDDPSALIIDLDRPADFIRLAFGNDDPGWSSPGDLAVLTVFLGPTQVGQTTVVMNRNDVMDQTISFHGGPFNRATFVYADPALSPIGLIEDVDDIGVNFVTHVTGLDFGNDTNPDRFEQNDTQPTATDVGMIVDEVIPNLTIKSKLACTITVTYPTGQVITGDPDDPDFVMPSITLQELLDGGSIQICDKLFDNFGEFSSVATGGGAVVNPADVVVVPDLPDQLDPGPGLQYQSAAFRAGAGQTQDTQFAYDVSNVYGLFTIVDNSAELSGFAVGAEGAIFVAETVFTETGFLLGNKLVTDLVPDAELNFAPQDALRIEKDIGLIGGTGAGAFFSQLNQNFSQRLELPPDIDWYEVECSATGSMEFVIDQRVGFVMADVVNGAGEVIDTASASRLWYGEDFESGAPGWAGSGLWTMTTDRGSDPGHSSTWSFYYGDTVNGTTGTGTLWSPMIDLSTVAPTDVGALLSFNYFLETDGAASGDVAQVQVYDYQTGTLTTVAANDTGELADPSTGFRRATTDLSPFLGHQIQLQFTYTADAVGNAVEGWYVDDVQVYVASNLDLHLEVPQLRGQTFWLRVQDDPNAPCNTAVYDLHVISHDKFDAFGASNDLEVSHGVAVFDNASYVDTSDGYWAESDTVQASLASFGHPVSTFTGTSAVDINAALAGNTVLLIPEAENGNLLSAFDAAARAAISGFVASGGGMVIHYADDAFLNAVFGFSVSTTSEYYTTYLDAVAAAGTPFESGPGSLDPFSATEALSISSLPAGSRAIYTDGGNEATVVLMPFGAGQIVYLGWDWYNAAPLGTEDGGWLRVLDSAVGQFTVATGGTDLGEVIYHLETELSAGAGDQDWFTFTEPVGDHPAKTIVMPLVDRDHDGILDPEET